MKILIAADGSDYTRRALDYLASHDWLRAGNELTVLYIVPALPHRAAARAGADLVDSYYQDDAERVIGPLRETMKSRGIDARFIHYVGHPAEHIARTAIDLGADLIVMGSHGHGSIGSLLLGSVTTKVLAMCKTPVLLIR